MKDEDKFTYGNPEKLIVGQMPDYAKKEDQESSDVEPEEHNLTDRAIKALTWMIADIDFRNEGLVDREVGLEKVEDYHDLADARELLKELKGELNGTL